MKLTKRAEQPQVGEQGNEAIRGQGLTRRAFMVNSSLGAGGAVAAGWLAPAMMQRAEAKTVAAGVPVEVKRTICSLCSVGCGVFAEVQNGVWTGQEPAFDHPFNLGGHCAKGAALREHGHGERRLKYPMKLVGGKWQRLSWEQAIEEVGN
ncbi:MAG: formate dehydrogenase, partial [Aeromonas veronii]